jgi:acyl-CoA thioesterase
MPAGHIDMQSFSSLVAGPVAPRPDGAVFRSAVTPDWLQGRVAFGGLQAAFGAVAMRAAVGDDAPPLRALKVTFLASVDPGEALADAEVVRRGRAVVHARCTLHSGGRPAALMVGLYGAARDSKVALDMPMPALRAPRELREVPFMPAVMPGFLQHYRQRWAGGSVPFSGAPYKPASMWTRLREATAGDDPDTVDTPLAGALATPRGREASLVATCDLPPSPALAMLTERAPGASLTWLLELLADPREVDPRQWLLMHTETRHAAHGYTSQTARIWSSDGTAVAVSHQTTAIFG